MFRNTKRYTKQYNLESSEINSKVLSVCHITAFPPVPYLILLQLIIYINLDVIEHQHCVVCQCSEPGEYTK